MTGRPFSVEGRQKPMLNAMKRSRVKIFLECENVWIYANT